MTSFSLLLSFSLFSCFSSVCICISLFQTPLFLSNYNMGRDESIYPNANSFLPERWLRENKEDEIHPFSSQPFGFGARACIGKFFHLLASQTAIDCPYASFSQWHIRRRLGLGQLFRVPKLPSPSEVFKR